MSASPPTDDTADRRTRRRLLESASTLLSREGLQPDLLPRAAAAAECSEERARKFFRRDEELILALYIRFAGELEEQVAELPEGRIADRFAAVMRAKFAIIEPFRDALAALTATMLDPRAEMGALNPQTEVVRLRMLGVMDAVIQGARDRPRTGTDRLRRGLYALHLGVMLVWCQDRTPDARSAHRAVALSRTFLRWARPALRIPGSRLVLRRLDDVIRPLIAPEDDEEVEGRAEEVLRRLFRHRRLPPEVAGRCARKPCPRCLSLHLPRVRYYLRAEEPIHFVLPAFPAKSPSRRKTLGPLPDRAEELALEYLERIGDEIAALHPPGVRITICSDGHVFSDVVGVSDAEVTRYGDTLRSLIHDAGSRWIETFAMAGLYEGSDYPSMRRQLLEQYGPSLDAIKERTRRLESERALYNGIHRFISEEQADVHPERSRSQVRKACRAKAYEVIRRSRAWSRLLAECFPTALRVSIHPHDPHGERIGILLGGSGDDVWLTPWHGVALEEGGEWRFVKRYQAEEIGAVLVERDGRPSHFELDD